MPYCSACGVEVGLDAVECPLCGMAIQGSDIGASRDENDERTPRLIDPEDRYRLSAAERRRLGMELISLAAALAATALILIDLLSDARLSWSLYAVVSLAMAWLASITPFAFHGKAWLEIGRASCRERV